MKWNLKAFNQEKNQFSSHYCLECKQTKPCQFLSREYCCSCFYQQERENAREYSTYEKTLALKHREKQETLKELKQLHSWKETDKCSYCGKTATQQDWLLSSELICVECVKGHSENCFTSWQKWYKKWWGINLAEWLEKYQCLPVNAKCAKKWLKNSQHLNNCDCLEQETREIYELFANSLKKYQEKLAKCKCKASEKTRVDSDYYTWCESCERTIAVASKKRVIKNRNNPTFWGLEVKEKVLCGDCLKN